jgi:ketosteroid isomerase-like protein
VPQEENVELVERAYEALNRQDLETVVELCDPEIEIDNTNAVFDAEVYHGLEGLARFFAQGSEMWESQRFEPEEYIPVGEEQVLVPQRIVSLGRDGIETIARNTTLYTLRGGRAVRVKTFQTKAAALEALGLAD